MSAPPLKTTRWFTALRWVLRIAGIGLMAVSGCVAFWAMGLCAVSILMAQGSGSAGWKIIFTLVFLIPAGLLARIGWAMFRKMNETTVENLAFLLALIFCNIWYRLLPAEMPVALARLCRENDFLSPFMEPPCWPFRGILAFLAFFVFYKLIAVWLLEKLGMSRPDSKRPPPSIRETPSSFDPYQTLS